MAIPDAAVKAATEARYDHGSDPQPYSPNRCRCGQTFPSSMAHLEHAMRRQLEAAVAGYVVVKVDDKLREATTVAVHDAVAEYRGYGVFDGESQVAADAVLDLLGWWKP